MKNSTYSSDHHLPPFPFYSILFLFCALFCSFYYISRSVFLSFYHYFGIFSFYFIFNSSSLSFSHYFYTSSLHFFISLGGVGRGGGKNNFSSFRRSEELFGTVAVFIFILPPMPLYIFPLPSHFTSSSIFSFSISRNTKLLREKMDVLKTKYKKFCFSFFLYTPFCPSFGFRSAPPPSRSNTSFVLPPFLSLTTSSPFRFNSSLVLYLSLYVTAWSPSHSISSSSKGVITIYVYYLSLFPSTSFCPFLSVSYASFLPLVRGLWFFFSLLHHLLVTASPYLFIKKGADNNFNLLSKN